MTSNDEPASDWAERLVRQGIDQACVSDAQAAGRKMATAADNLAFDPEEPIAPGDFLAVLEDSAKASS